MLKAVPEYVVDLCSNIRIALFGPPIPTCLLDAVNIIVLYVTRVGSTGVGSWELKRFNSDKILKL